VQNRLAPNHERLLVEWAPVQPEAFQELYRHYLPRVFAYIAYRVGREQDAEDLTSETFLSVVEHLNDFVYRHEGAFAAWIFRIAQNKVNQFFRRNHRQQGAVPLDAIPEIASSELLPADILSRKERFVMLCGLIDQLSPRRQEVVQLKYFAGLANIEIAALLELDERTIASHLSRALDDLQHHYQAILAAEEDSTS
jgi:RNA polymerase sigma-70 factor (ECF subfamily)